MGPSLSIITPTAGRLTLVRVLDSIRAAGLLAADEVLIVTDGPQPATESLVREMDVPAKIITGPKTADWGNSQRNYALEQQLAKGDYVMWLDDDDCVMPFALVMIRAALAEAPGRPHLFRFRTHVGNLVWTDRGKVERCHVGGHCIVAPNDPAKLGRWSDSYSGDFDFIASTLAHYSADAVVWREEVITHQNAARGHCFG
jgi:hypothetical protein